MIGIKNGMVMQRDADGRCDVILTSDVPLHTASWEGNTSGQAVLETCGEGVYRLTGIPAGGPYTVTIDGQCFHDVYVGDLWILAGQSNMEGIGWLTPDDQAFAGRDTVRALYMNDEWGIAKHPLHERWKAVDKVHTDVLGIGELPHMKGRWVGPGLEFALQMERYCQVPQGVLCCAHGSTAMEHWNPDLKELGGDKSLYAAMLRRVKTNGSHVRGIFWYQGCSDAHQPAAEHFSENMERFVTECRRDFGADLPFVQVQICRMVTANETMASPLWTRIREQQRNMGVRISRLATISTVGKRLDDSIHLSSHSQRQVGRQAAEAMYWLLYGTDRHGCLPPPSYRGYQIYEDGVTGTAIVEVSYDNLHGDLVSAGRPVGFAISCKPDILTDPIVLDTWLRNDKALIRTGVAPRELEGCWLFYGFGMDPVCSIQDQAGREIPAMGPIKLTLE